MNKKILIWIFVLIALSSFVSAAVVDSYTAGANNWNFGSVIPKAGHVWTSSQTYNMYYMAVATREVAPLEKAIFLEVYTDNGANLPNVFLGKSNNSYTTFGAGYAYYNFTFPSGISLTNGNKYVFILGNTSVQSGDDLSLQRSAAAGTEPIAYWNGAGWSGTGTNYQVNYKTYNNTITPPIPPPFIPSVSIDLLLPVNDTLNTTDSYNFTFNVTSNVNISKCSLLIDGNINKSKDVFNNYSRDNIICSGTNCGNMYDGDWDTYGTIGTGQSYRVYYTYTGTHKWKVKDGTGNHTLNITKIYTYLIVSRSGSDLSYQGFDGLSFDDLYTSVGTDRLYEEVFYDPAMNFTESIDQTLPEGSYLWSIQCTQDNGSVYKAPYNFTLEIDVTVPTINLTGIWNGTVVINKLKGDIQVGDKNLYSLNISDSVTGTIFNISSITTSTYNYTLDLNTLSYPQGKNILNIRVADGHTSNKINDYIISRGLLDNNIIYRFDDDGWVSVNPEGITGIITTKKVKDRYLFTYDKGWFEDLNEKVFYVSSSDYIDIIKNSVYNGHLVVPALDKWIDFEEVDGNVANVERISDNMVKVTVIPNKKDKEELTFHSIGDLNVVSVNLTWYNAKATYSYSEKVAENVEDTYTVSVNHTGMGSYFDNMDGTMFFNGTKIVQDSKLTLNEITTWSYIHTAPEIVNYEAVVNISFLVNITSGTNITSNLISDNQTIIKLAIGNCNDSAFNFSALNITGYDETFYNNTVNFTLNADFNLYLLGEPTVTQTHQQFTGSYTYALCLRNNNTDLYADATFEYFDPDGKFSNRKYYLYQYRLNDTDRFLKLYLINDSVSSDITLKVFDNNGHPLPNIFVKVLRYYPELGSSFVVEIGKTDNEGKTGSKQVLADPLYSYIIQSGNIVRLTTNPGRLLSTTKTFTLGSTNDQLESFSNILNIENNLYYDELTHRFNFVWNDATGLTDTMCLEVIKRSGFKDSVVCPDTNCLSANAGNLFCDIGVNPDGQYLARVILETTTQNSEYTLKTFSRYFNVKSGRWGKEGIIGAIMLVSAGAMAMVSSPIMVIIATLVGLLGAILLSTIHIGAGLFVTALVVGIIIIMRLKE